MENYSCNIKEYYKKLLSRRDTSIPKKKSWKLIYDNNYNRMGNVAISENDKNITYEEMFQSWKEQAKVFTSLGIVKNSRGLVLMPNLSQTANIQYGLNMTGAVCDFIDPTSNIDKIEEYIKNENVTDIIISNLLYEQNMKKHVERIKREYSIRNIILYNSSFLNSYMPSPIKLYINAKSKFPCFDKNIIRYDDAVKNTKYTQIAYDNYVENILSLITHTSGTTTGIGKPIPITDDNRNALAFQHELAGLKFEPGMKMLHFIPYFAAYGAVNTVHLGLYMGMELIQIPLFKPENFGKLLLEHKPNIVLANTPAWMSLITDDSLKNIDLSFLECAVSGGTPTNPKDEEKLNEFLLNHGSKCILTKGHGLSELCGCGSYTIDGYNHIGGMGVPLPLTTYKIRDLTTNEIVDENNAEFPLIGEALINCPNMTSGILDDKVIIEMVTYENKKYLPSKDVVAMNSDGSLEFVERTDRMFPRYDAYNVYPLHIESMMNNLKEVSNSIILSYCDSNKNGNMPLIYIQLNEQYKDINVDEFIMDTINKQFLSNSNTSGYKANFRDIPSKWIFVENIPKNTMGKDDYYYIKNNGLDGITYNVIVEADNLNVSKIDVIKEKEKIKTIHL